MPFPLQNAFRINSNVDVADILGTGWITRTRVYGRIGTAYTQLKQIVFI